MYGYRQSNENGLMTNLNSISSSLSSIDTIGMRNNTKASADNLIAPRNQPIASTSLLWNGPKDDRYSNATSVKNGTRYTGSEIYYNGNRGLGSYCFNSKTALNFILVPLLLLTITRQVFDFLGQIWLQILVNFFTIILIIVALFGIRQHRIFYLGLYALWALFNTVWNLMVLCIHTRLRDVGLTEDDLSFRTGATSWWHSNGPGCLPYNISSMQPISILQPNSITGCRIDYRVIESTQAAIHTLLSFVSSLICCCVLSNIRRRHSSKMNNMHKSDKLFRLNNLINDRSKVNQDPFPDRTSRFGSNSASLRRAPNKTSSRSSQHSVSSMRSARRRVRQPSTDGTLPNQRGSTSSNQRSQKYGSVSSRRSNKKERRSDISSLTYGTTGDRSARRTRLSSLSSVDYLPSYQPPHSSSANLLSSYGEISSIDSYNNHTGHRSARNRQASIKSIGKGNTNPTYTGSRSSVCSHNTNTNNYDDLSYIYGNNSVKNSDNLYGASNGVLSNRQRQQIYQQSKTNSSGRRSNFRGRDQQASVPQKIHAETYQLDQTDGKIKNGNDTIVKSKLTNGGFHSFSVANQQAPTTSRAQTNDENHLMEVNNNHLANNYQSDNIDKRGHSNGSIIPATNSTDNRSRAIDGSMNMSNQSQIYANNQRNSRYPIYLNHEPNGNSETPI